jgi:hypothetical protein
MAYFTDNLIRRVDRMFGVGRGETGGDLVSGTTCNIIVGGGKVFSCCESSHAVSTRPFFKGKWMKHERTYRLSLRFT